MTRRPCRKNRVCRWGVLTGVLLMPSPSSAQAGDRFDAWIGFSDKGVLSAETRQAAFRTLEATFDPRALERRRLRRTLPGLFDDHDLPLHEPYLAELRDRGVEVRVRSRWLNGVTVLATASQLQALDSLPFVAQVTDIRPHAPKGEGAGPIPRDPDLRRGAPPGPMDPYGWSGTQIRQLNLNSLHEAGFRGRGVRIGVIDTGFSIDHPAFRNPENPLRVVGQWDFMDNDPFATPEAGDGVDQHEHGTLILGALAADAPGELMGSAPDAEYILLKAEDAGPEFFLEEKWFVAALEFAEAHGADIVSSSVVLYEGYSGEDVDGQTSVMAQGWNLATGNGVIGFQGGGNSGHDEDPRTHHLLPPAGAPKVITVGAVDGTGEIARFSSDGLELGGTVKPEVLALGLQTRSVSPYLEGAYSASGGTSMATPVLAGGVACILQIHPDWTVDQLREALFSSGNDFLARGRPDPLFIRGFGVPDLALAADLPSGGSR